MFHQPTQHVRYFKYWGLSIINGNPTQNTWKYRGNNTQLRLKMYNTVKIFNQPKSDNA